MKRSAKILIGIGAAATVLAIIGSVYGKIVSSSKSSDIEHRSYASYELSAETVAAAAEIDFANSDSGYVSGAVSGASNRSFDIALEDDFGVSIVGEGEPIDVSDTDIPNEMLIYRCWLSIDTLDFQSSVQSFKSMVSFYGGFVENENMSDGAYFGGYYYLDEEEKTYTYSATVRIPSENYNSFVSESGSLGDIRSQNAYVENVSQRYGTLASELEIYEAEYDRYLEQLANTEDDYLAMDIQNELTDLAITIADIKTSMSLIESDVQYSYITIDIREVEELVEEEEVVEEEEEDTFLTRLKATFNDSWSHFSQFLENILFGLIYSFWYIIIIAVVAVVIVCIVKSSVKKRKKKAEKKAQAQNNEAKTIVDESVFGTEIENIPETKGADINQNK